MADQDRIDQLRQKVDALNDKIKALANKKDAAVAKYRADLLALNADRDAAAVELAAVQKLAGLSDAERAAIAAEVATSGGGN